MRNYKYIILGGGVAAGYAAKSFAEAGIDSGELAIISAESSLPYERPPLSKAFLAGDKSPSEILINDQAFYDDHGIAVFLETRIQTIEPEKSALYSKDDTFTYEKLLICTGSRVRTLDIPGAEWDGVHYLRSLADSMAIREQEYDIARVVILGGGYIGMEVASQMRQKNYEVTMVFPEDALMKDHFFTKEMSEFFEEYYREQGVKFIKGEKAVEIIGSNGHLTNVRLDSGKTLETDLVIAGIGVIPNIDLFEKTSIRTEEGILVDHFLTSSISNIYVAGDVATYHDVIFDKHRRIEHWNNAVTQGQYAAQVMTNQTREPYREIPYFFSDIFDLSYEFWGDVKEADRVVYRGELSAEGFSVWWLQQNRLVAAFVMGRPDEEREFAQMMIANGEPVAATMLEDSNQSLKAPNATA
ncbi:MAG: FAD-dependent oxidoreductase [Aggregatilineales bacterium]